MFADPVWPVSKEPEQNFFKLKQTTLTTKACDSFSLIRKICLGLRCPLAYNCLLFRHACYIGVTIKRPNLIKKTNERPIPSRGNRKRCTNLLG